MTLIRRTAAAALAAAAAVLALTAGCAAVPADDGRSVAPAHPSAPAGAGAPRLRGIALPSWSAEDYDSPAAGRYLRDIAATGAGWVSLTPTWYQSAPGDASMHTTGETASDDSLRRIIREAHAAGLKVLLKPHVDLPGDQDRAQIRPADPAAWFAAYTRFITHYARLAEDLGAEQLSVGTELAGTSRDGARWRAVVRAVRRDYRGPLVYAANYDEYAHIPFWDDLDLIGVDAYWPLADRPTTDVGRLRAAWRPIARQLSGFAARHHRRVLFTEAGYVSQRGTTTAPWSWTVSARPADDEQAAAYQALLGAMEGERWWAGVCWWMWDDWPDSGETPARLAYTPHGKPAEEVLRRSWRR
ncbi:hypothetical protein ABZ883_31255 [Streptomyces sp. NPDC046977]|uniref:glycoside hydrolase family 113 n=1 Tax=Streptomyces sp. NPDC046977 TaxID=3154703 RepID=UPI0033DEF2BF